jgi:replication-associated recombination protein RarA
VIYGHEDARRQLERGLRPVTLLMGPDSVGKWTLAEHAARYHRAIPAEVIRAQELSADQASDIRMRALRAPLGPIRAVLIRVDRAKSETALNTLLKILEEPPAPVRFILTASTPPMPTIVSRSTVVRLGLLSDADVERVLVQSMGLAEDIAARLAPLGRGQVKRAADADSSSNSRQLVVALLKAAATGDAALADRASRSWDDEAHDLLWTWAFEAGSGRWRVFSAEESFGLAGDPSASRRLVAVLSNAGRARPRVAVRVAAEALMRNVSA